MAGARRITSRDNALARDLRRLAHSARERRRSGIALLDGPHLVAAFAAAGGTAKTLVVAEHAQARPEIARLFAHSAAEERVVVPDRLFEELSGVASPVGILACAAVPDPGPLTALAGDTLVLDRLQEPGNVGSILRTAAAAGVRTVIATVGTAFLWSPKVLRAAMGAHFGLVLHEDASAASLAACAREGDLQCLALALRSNASLYAAELRRPTLWMLGNEGAGLDPALVALADRAVEIPMPGGSESLNVAAAAAVALFEQVRQRYGARGAQ